MPLSFPPRTIPQEILQESHHKSAVSLCLLSGVGSLTGGPTVGSKASYIGNAKNIPLVVIEAEDIARSRREEEEKVKLLLGPEPDYNVIFIDSVLKQVNLLCNSFTLHLGKCISKKERREIGKLESTSHMYHEFPLNHMLLLLQKIKYKYGVYNKISNPFTPPEGIFGDSNTGGRFYDLGSGTGKICLAAFLIHEFEYVCGIEQLEGLHTTAIELQSIWDSQSSKLLPMLRNTVAADGDGDKSPNLESVLDYQNCDFRDVGEIDWTTGDIIFINCTTFSPEILQDVTSIAEQLKVGAFVITTTNRLPSKEFHVVEMLVFEGDNGMITTFIQQRMPIIEEDIESVAVSLEKSVEDEADGLDSEEEGDEVDQAEVVVEEEKDGGEEKEISEREDDV